MRREEVEITQRHRPVEYIQAGAWAVVCLLVFLLVLAFSIVKLRGKFVSIGDSLNEMVNVWVDAFLVLVAISLVIAIVAVVWRIRNGTYIPVNQFGMYWKNWRGEFTPLPPIAISAPGVSSVSITEVKPVTPRLGELVKSNSLTKESPDGLLMFQGFHQDGSTRYGETPGVIGVAGAQNAGKSVTIANLAVIFAMQSSHIVVCDTHHTKPRSLYKKLEALDDYMTFAKTEDQVLEQAQCFSEELANRKRGSDPYPYVFILDEAASILKRSDVGKEVIPIIEQCGQEGHGYNMTIILGIHDFSIDGLGDIRIREWLNFIYCHRMSIGQVKFIPAFNSKETKNLIASLPSGQAVIKDEFNEVDRLTIPFADSSDVLVARTRIIQRPPLLLTSNSKEVEYKMEPLPLQTRVLTNDSGSSDLDRVKAAWNEIEKPSRRKVAARTGFSDTKAGDLINELKRMNEIV